ncbi:hypothetical protein LOAG_12095 [Loa loa]|uniref:Uncharacterized protein n=1 Tax=Loa loa TaxID=7209 RepID=A0A1S0TLV0_LOALO|nr:hypothetical protein LOAG_12095 [Loa loa]EFO16412.1 hypothetical protein LOAG_12095 [Loa loa]
MGYGERGRLREQKRGTYAHIRSTPKLPPLRVTSFLFQTSCSVYLSSFLEKEQLSSQFIYSGTSSIAANSQKKLTQGITHKRTQFISEEGTSTFGRFYDARLLFEGKDAAFSCSCHHPQCSVPSREEGILVRDACNVGMLDLSHHKLPFNPSSKCDGRNEITYSRVSRLIALGAICYVLLKSVA